MLLNIHHTPPLEKTMKHITVAEPSWIDPLTTFLAANPAPLAIGVAVAVAMIFATVAVKLGWAG